MQAQVNRLTTTDSQPILHQLIRASVLTFILLVCFGTISIAQAAPLQQHTLKLVTTPVKRAALPENTGAFHPPLQRWGMKRDLVGFNLPYL